MLRVIHVTVLLFGVRALFSEEINVALGSSCCASSELSDRSCGRAIDGRSSTGWTYSASMWYRLDLKRLYNVTRMIFKTGYEKRRKNIRLTFSDGSSQEITSPDGSDHKWEFKITPVTTYTVKIGFTGSTTLVEVEVYADRDVIPTAQVGCCQCKITGDVPTSTDTWGVFRRNRQCILECVGNKECVAALFPIDGGNCTHYHLNCAADKAVHGTEYVMWRPKREG